MNLEIETQVQISSEDYECLFESLVDSLYCAVLYRWTDVRNGLTPDLLVNGVSAQDADTAIKMAACHFMDDKDYAAWDIVDYVGNLLFDVV